MEKIAIVGVSALFPGSLDATGFWRDILAGTDLITDVPPSHWLVEDYYDPDPSVPDKTYAKRGGFLPDVAFDAIAWGVPPKLAPSTDTAQLLALIVAQKVLDDATRGQFASLDRERVSVILGVTSAQELLGSMVSRLQHPIWRKTLREAGLPEDEVNTIIKKMADNYPEWTESTFPGLLGNVVAGRIANRLDLRGTNCVTDAACASTMSAMSMAVNELVLGQADLVVTGGVDTMNDIFMFMCFSKTPAMSKTGDCRPFSASGDGTMLGEGIGMVALKRLADAERDGDRIYAVISAIGSSSDGRSKSVYAPVPDGQARALQRTYAAAGYGPETVELLEAHGTGTVAGDAAEYEGLTKVFGPAQGERAPWCALGSVKSQIGHAKAAAGAAGVFKAVMALHHKVLPPTIKVEAPNPAIDAKGPFYLSTRVRPWIRGSDHPRRASVSSFGFGGSNFHVALEEYGGEHAAERFRTFGTELVLVSAGSAAELASRAEGLAGAARAEHPPHDPAQARSSARAVPGSAPSARADTLHAGASTAQRADGERSDAGLQRLAQVTQATFDAGAPARLAVVASSLADLRAKVAQALPMIRKGASFSLPTGVHFSAGGEPGGVAFLFPGQGSQRLDMGAELAMGFAAARGAWDRAADQTFARAQHPQFDPAQARSSARAVPGSAPSARDATLHADASTAQRAEGERSQWEIGLRLHDVVFPRPTFDGAEAKANEERITRTEWAQPALGVASMAALRLLRAVGVAPSVVAGHSFGELSALCAAGAIGEIDLVRLARARGERMAAAASVAGAMLAVTAERATVEDVVAGTGAVVANHNAPDQVVLSGTVEAIAAAEARLAAKGLAGKRLRVATAFHSSVVAGATSGFAEDLGEVKIGRPSIPVIANSTADEYPADEKGIRALLAGQIASPVRWVETIERMYRDGVRTFVEVGAGAVLSGLVDRILGDRPHRAIPVDRAGADGIAAFWGAIGQLAVAGVPVRTEALWEGFRVEEPAQKPAMSITINGANTGKPYPPAGGAKALPKPNPKRAAVVAAPIAVAPVVPVATASPVGVAAPVAAAPAVPVAAASSVGVAPIAPVATASSVDASVQMAWVAAFQETQAQTAEAHAAYQRAMADSHAAFLRTSEAAFQGLAGLLGASPSGFAASPAPIAAYIAPAPAVAVAAPGHAAPSTDPVGARFIAPGPAAAAPVAAGRDLRALVLDVVAEKTGYPAEMLGLEMALEADLGIDSIKRVEILSAVREQAPELPEVDAAELGALRTLGEIVSRLGPVGAVTSAPAAPASPGRDLRALVLGVVAEKTGYPAEMLGLDMALEADLGIDSIKRVEILSAVREQAPELPEVDAAELGALRTLGEIVSRLGPVGAALPVAAPATPGRDLRALVLGVVAEKTGYPAEMLGLDMALEADLGIDSIKRVEILSAVREQAPELPEVDAAELGALRTLGEIVSRLGPVAAQGHGRDESRPYAAVPGHSAPSTDPVGARFIAPGAAGRDLRALVLGVVAEKTGYPAEMLGLDMALEADLGIDSIKRVEILSAVREQAPELPDVDAAQLGALRTLGEIVARLGDGGAPAAPAPEAAAIVEASDVGRFATGWRPVPAPGLALPGLAACRRLVITDDGEGVAPALAKRLAEAGISAEIVADVPSDADGAVLLDGLRPAATAADALAHARSAFRAARTLAPTLSKGGVLVTLQDDRGPIRAWLGGIASLAKTAALEWEAAHVKAIRADRDVADIADAIAAELLGGGDHREVSLVGGRALPVATEIPASGGQPALSKGDVVVVSGGARGVTAAAVTALGKATGARFALLGRTPLDEEAPALRAAKDEPALKRALLEKAKAEGRAVTPADIGRQTAKILANREIRGTLDALAAAGCAARYVAADVGHAGAISSAIREIRAWGPIRGIIHGAGVLADKLLVDKTDAHLEQVLGPKVLGLKHLLDATSSDDLSLLVLFSSVAAWSGNPSQSDYALANGILDAVARAEAARRPSCKVRSIGWGPWRGGMVTPALEAKFRELGVPLVGLAEGGRFLVEEVLHGAPDDVVIVVGGAPGHGPLGAGDPTFSGEVRFDAEVRGRLSDHAIDGTPVVPVVFAIEWLARAARAVRSDLHLVAIRDLRVLRGIRVDAPGLVTRAWQISNGTGALVGLELRTPDKVHYTATAELSEAASVARRPGTEPRTAPFEDVVYDGHVLFHGPAFQVLDGVGLSDDGAVAGLATSKQIGWPESWRVDPAALDGALQLAVLWARQRLGGATLPTKLDGWLPYGEARGPLRVVVRPKSQHPSRVVVDVSLVDGDRVVTELQGLEVHLRPGEGA